ncbi:MAG: hypothetical protein A2044_04100 [Candidatus Firestonebacteria bacterium GWA2_43_8]|nr:MAG: hypothetical protein A2044_04100 [Candidatus Firestonebacteria bacterium GWA2_43_8]
MKKILYLTATVLLFGILTVIGCGKNPILSYLPEQASSGGGGGTSGTGTTIITYFSDDFESYAVGALNNGMGGWYVNTTGTGALDIFSENFKKVLKYSGTGDYGVTISRSITPVAKATLEFYFKNGHAFTFRLTDDKGAQPVSLILSSKLRVMVNGDSTDTLAISGGVWNKVSIGIDITQLTYVVKLNNIVAKTGSLVAYTGTSLNGLVFSEGTSGTGTSTTYYDNLLITDQ